MHKILIGVSFFVSFSFGVNAEPNLIDKNEVENSISEFQSTTSEVSSDINKEYVPEPISEPEYYIVDGSINLVKELSDLSNQTNDPKIAYESARFANYISENVVKARNEGQEKIIVINLPSYTLYSINIASGKTDIETKIIVGKTNSKTPVFSTNIKSITLNPTWTPPVSVLRRSVYPSLGKKGGYADKHGLVINKNGYLLPLSTPSITKDDLSGYSIYQPSGINNSLGRMRFNTDNNIAIYLHDTNDRSLFNKDYRALSLGCVRVKDWENLALWIANWKPDWLSKNVNAKNEDGSFVTKTFIVPKINVAMGYFTIKKDLNNNWVNTDNIYKRDD